MAEKMSSSSGEPANFEKKIPRRSPRLAAAANKQQIPQSPGGEKKRGEKRHSSSSGDPSYKGGEKRHSSSPGDPSNKGGEKRHSSSPAHPEIRAPERPILSRAEYRALEKDEEKRRQAFIAKVCLSASTRDIMINCYPRRPKYFDGPC